MQTLHLLHDNAAKADQAFHDRAHKLPSENADEAMKSYGELAQLHADNMLEAGCVVQRPLRHAIRRPEEDCRPAVPK
jgi:hypothetical protein